MARKLYLENELSDAWKDAVAGAVRLGKLKNHKLNTQRNDKDVAIWVALDFQDQGVMNPQDIEKEDWLQLIERYRDGETRSRKPLKEMSIKKRKEGLLQILKALNLKKIKEFVDYWKPHKEAKSIRWWTEEEMEAMNQTAIHLFESKYRMRAIAHMLHFHIGPRRSDTALFTWERIDLRAGMISFPATKNRKRCQTKIEPRFIQYFQKYKDSMADVENGAHYLFPKSAVQRSGTDKKGVLHVSNKTISTWLQFIRDETKLRNGTDIRPFPSHSYRHSIAMRYLNKGCTYEDVSSVLGDTISTIEKHYSELIYTPAREAAFNKAHSKANRTSSEGTAQPEWLERHTGGSDSFPRQAPSSTNSDGESTEGYGRWGI